MKELYDFFILPFVTPFKDLTLWDSIRGLMTIILALALVVLLVNLVLWIARIFKK